MNSTTNNILVPIDFSEQSIIGLEQSYNLAKFTKAKITLLNVIEGGSIWRLFSSKEQKDVINKMRSKLENLAQEVSKKSGIKVNTLIEKGKLVDKILGTANKLNATFIVMGTTSVDNIKRKVIGTNALQVVREAKCPVITIKGKYHLKGCENIVLPLDLTKETKEKVSRAIQFAKMFDSTIHVVSVVSTNDNYLISRYKTQLKQVQKFIQRKNVQCSAKTIKSSGKKEKIAKTLIDYAHKVEADLIIILTQQEIKITEYFIGSLAKEIIHGSTIPVMSIVPSRKLLISPIH